MAAAAAVTSVVAWQWASVQWPWLCCASASAWAARRCVCMEVVSGHIPGDKHQAPPNRVCFASAKILGQLDGKSAAAGVLSD